MNNILFLLIFLVIGYMAQKILNEQKQIILANFLNKFVIYISLPALVIVYMIDLQVDKSMFLPAVTAWALFFATCIVILILSKYLHFSRTITAAMLMTSAFGNSSFLGIPFTKAFFGDSAVAYAIVYDQLGSFLILSTFGVVILSIYSSKTSSIPIVIFKIITFPSFLAMILALTLNSSVIPIQIMTILKYISATLMPVALIAIGLFLKLKIDKEHLKPFYIALFVKLIVAPLTVLLIFHLLNLNSLASKVTVLETAMAPMVSSSMLAVVANIERRFIVSVLGYGIALSFLTVPLFYKLLQ